MGLLNKLKNALFEEEEIEIERTPDKVVIKDEEEVVKKVEPVKQEIPLENERELFKAENTFNFPDFDEEEFVSNYEPVKEEKKEKRTEYERPKLNTRDTEKEKKEKDSKNNGRRLRSKTVEEPHKTFTPSPIISPVYGVLDKNYKKEDLKTVTKSTPKKKTFDVDMARKKAFGTLEEDIEKTLSEPIETFYERENKSIDELLNDSIDDTIDISYADNADLENTLEVEDMSKSIEEELDKIDEETEEKNKLPKKKEYDEKYLEDNTLESDLFDLIDSMYDNREDD
jgi:hypothetical protein